MGRLSNPPEHLKALVEKGLARPTCGLKRPSRRLEAIGVVAEPTSPEERDGFQTLVDAQCNVGFASLRSSSWLLPTGPGVRCGAIADVLAVHHDTIAALLEQLGILPRASKRKMSADDVHTASRRYEAGESLATLGATYDIDPATIRRELGSRHHDPTRRGWR